MFRQNVPARSGNSGDRNGGGGWDSSECNLLQFVGVVVVVDGAACAQGGRRTLHPRQAVASGAPVGGGWESYEALDNPS